jgi:hypothetical protein
VSSSARWTLGTLLGLGAWIGAMVVVAMVSGDPRDPTPILLTFLGGAALFFGTVFGVALWQTRRRPSAALDHLLASLTLEGATPPTAAAAYVGGRRTVRLYLVMGIVVTALGLTAIALGMLGSGFTVLVLGALALTVVGWAAAVPLVLRERRAAASALLEPLGLELGGAGLAGRRHGRAVSITFSARGTRTRVTPEHGDPVVIERSGHTDDGWLRDLVEAERRADAASS